MKSKKEVALEFIQKIRVMDAGDLSKLIRQEAGEELAQFFLSYSANLINKDPANVLSNTASLMLMGYLIRMAEDRAGRTDSGTYTLPVATA
jgi:hypothetical protein